jgi:hypothetical protein
MVRKAGFALLILLMAAESAGACDTNRAVGYGGPYEFEYTNSSPTWDAAIFAGHVSYDLIAGTFGATGGGGGGKQSGGVQLQFSDSYKIVGPPLATPISFQATFHVGGTLNAALNTYPFIGTGCDQTSARFTATSGSASVSHDYNILHPGCETRTLDDGMTLELSKLPGESFPFSMLLSVFGTRTGNVNGTFQFTGLPAGYVIQSCQGYGGLPVPAQKASWGSLKHSYRLGGAD